MAHLNGRLSLGLVAQSMPCRVDLTPSGLSIGAEDGVERTWPLESLRVSVPLSAWVDDVLISARAEPGTTLYLADRTVMDALARRAPGLSAAGSRWRWSKPGLVAASTIAVAFGALFALGVSPASLIAAQLPDAMRVKFGQNVIKSISGNRRECTQPAGTAALKVLADKLLAGVPNASSYRISVVDWAVVNAFTAPGGQIILTRGLIEKAQSADEVTGVLGHEVGHAIERHPEIGIIRVLGLSAASELMLGGSSGTLGNVGIALAQLSYSREAEREADQHAFRLLKAAQVSPKGIADFFHRMAGTPAEKGTAGVELLASHPASTERAALAEAQPAYEARPALTDAIWNDLQKICPAPAVARPVAASPPATPATSAAPAPPSSSAPPAAQSAAATTRLQTAEAASIANATSMIAKNPNDDVAYRQRALSYMKVAEYDAAVSDWTNVLRIKPNDVDGFAMRGWAKFNKNDFAGALEDANTAVRRQPKDVFALSMRGRTLYALKRYPEAVADFRASTSLREDAVEQYSLGLALVAANEPKSAIAAFSKAIALDKDFVTAIYNRGLANEAAGDRSAAIADFRAAAAVVLPVSPRHVTDPASQAGARERLKALKATVSAPAAGQPRPPAALQPAPAAPPARPRKAPAAAPAPAPP